MTTINNYTTKIKCAKTVGEIQEMLADHGADTINLEYRDRLPSAVSFTVVNGGSSVAFRLPINPDALLTRMIEADTVPSRLCTIEHARRVAWRNVRQWLQAQLQFIADGQVEFAQAMLPYALMPDGRGTVYELIESRQLLLGTSGMSEVKTK